MVLSYYLFKQIFGRSDEKLYEEKSEKERSKHSRFTKLMDPGQSDLLNSYFRARYFLSNLRNEQLHILSEDGLKLNGYYYRNESGTGRTVILVHGYASSARAGITDVAINFYKKGYSLLIIDQRACGSSEGKYQTFGVMENKDLRLWVDEISRLYPDEKVVIHGTSMGGATVCMSSDGNVPDALKVIVSDCAFARLEEQVLFTIKSVTAIPPYFLRHQLDFWFNKKVGCHFADQGPLRSVGAAKVPMIFIHGDQDRYVPVANATQLFDNCISEKKLVIVDGAGHASSSCKEYDDYFKPMFEFIERFI